MSTDYNLIDESVGLVGGIVLLVGLSVGMSIFIVPTQMAILSGPNIVLAILLAVPPILFAGLMLLQLGGAIPVAGGIYVYGSRLVGPFAGLLGAMIPVTAIWAYLIFLGLGTANYAAFFVDLPTLAHTMVPVTLILGAFLLINYFGLRLTTWVQMALVASLLTGMGIFVAFGFLNFDAGNLTPLFPADIFGGGDSIGAYGPFFIAIVSLYIPLTGFGMIIEIGEELEDPVKNIPRVLFAGIGIIVVVSVAVVLALVGAVPWDSPILVEAAEEGGGLATIATEFAPGWAALFVAVTALLAAATSVNTLYTSYSRTIMRAAHDEVFPKPLADIHDGYQTPYRAILVLGVPPIVLTPVAMYLGNVFAVDPLDWLVVIVVSGTMIAMIIGSIALWNLPKMFPQRYEHSLYRLPMPVLKFVAVGNLVLSVVFLIFTVLGMPSAFATLVAVMLLAYVGHRYRVRQYAKKGIDLEERMSLLHNHERIGGGRSGDD